MCTFVWFRSLTLPTQDTIGYLMYTLTLLSDQMREEQQLRCLETSLPNLKIEWRGVHSIGAVRAGEEGWRRGRRESTNTTHSLH